MENQEKQAYQLEYEIFIKNYKKGITSGEEIGYIISKLAQYYAGTNMEVGRTEDVFNKIFAETINSIDASGKPISAAKAKIDADATQEASESRNSKIHLDNIGVYINSLKSLQRGILAEQGFAGGV